MVFCGLGVQRGPALAPVRQQLLQGGRLYHRAGQDVRAHLAGLFHHADRRVRCQLFQANGGGQSCGACAHDDGVELHCLAFGHSLAVLFCV